VDKLNELSVKVSPGEEENEELRRELLMKCAATAMSSKLIHQVKHLFLGTMKNSPITIVACFVYTSLFFQIVLSSKSSDGRYPGDENKH
jgi:hypothetical protein